MKLSTAVPALRGDDAREDEAHVVKRIIMIGLAYFGVTVGAGFASGQEMLQYYVSYGWWGVAGALVNLLVMPITAMAILQYGSYFRAQSHGKVFHSITSMLVAKFMDYGLSVAQFCVGFVMLAGAGSNLHQQFGLPLWVGSALMVVLVLGAGMLNTDRVSNLIGGITPLMIALLLAAVVYAVLTFDGTLEGVHQFALQHGTPALPNWFLATVNYTGLSMFSGIAMAIIIGGSNWSPRAAGWGGFLGGLIFSGLLLLMVVALLLRIEDVYDADLPTLALIDKINPVLGVIASVGTYLMIFSTALGVFYSLGRRLAAPRPAAGRLIFAVVTLVGFGLSFLPFTSLVNNVFPVIGWLGVLFVAILLGTWLMSARTDISEEGLRRDRIRALLLYRLDPQRRWTPRHANALIQAVDESNLRARQLGDFVAPDLAREAQQTRGIEISEEEQSRLGERLSDLQREHREGSEKSGAHSAQQSDERD
ncbi:YkvI family membrane protein [Kocuria varians]|uniref:YkvI family membrane protein n=1 Tax=Kocuria varians TaxID=1272 RepID=UPI0012E93E26